jgi:hypothetical protein
MLTTRRHGLGADTKSIFGFYPIWPLVGRSRQLQVRPGPANVTPCRCERDSQLKARYRLSASQTTSLTART